MRKIFWKSQLPDNFFLKNSMYLQRGIIITMTQYMDSHKSWLNFKFLTILIIFFVPIMSSYVKFNFKELITLNLITLIILNCRDSNCFYRAFR